MRVAGTARHQTLDCSTFPVLPVAYRALLGEDLFSRQSFRGDGRREGGRE
jgi:hypothetical protein